MSKYNWAAELVRDITITSPFHSKIIIGQRCSECGTPAPQLAPEIQQHAAGLNRLEEHGRTESDEEVPRAVTTQQPTKPNKMNEGPESSELRAFEQKGSSTGSDECNKSDGGWNLPGECPVIEHNYGMDLESLSSLTNIQTLRWAGLETSKDHLHVLREICKANQGHLTSLDLDLYSWSMVNSSWHRRSEISSGPQSRPQSSNLFVSELLNRTGTLTALESLSIRKASLRDVSIDYAKCLNIGRLRSLHLHRCKQASSFLNGLASAVEKKQIHLSLTDFELMLDEPSPYGTYVGRFLECFTGLWRGIRYKNETLRDLIFHNEDIDCMALSKRKEYPIWEHAAGTLSVLYLHRFAYYGHLAENVKDPHHLRTGEHTDKVACRIPVVRR